MGYLWDPNANLVSLKYPRDGGIEPYVYFQKRVKKTQQDPYLGRTFIYSNTSSPY
jgi:hypothetical protein